MSKDRVLLMICVNMTGSEKLPLHQVQHLKCVHNTLLFLFTAQGIQSIDQTLYDNRLLLLIYYYNKKSCMASPVFEKWLAKWNQDLQWQGRKVSLLIGNPPSHNATTQTSIWVQFLPSYNPVRIQPTYHGVHSPSSTTTATLYGWYLSGLQDGGDARTILKELDLKITSDKFVHIWNSIPDIIIEKCFYKLVLSLGPISTRGTCTCSEHVRRSAADVTL